MSKEKIELMVEGGKATAAPPLGPALGPLKLNIGQVVGAINEKTKSFAGMKVPVKLIVDTETKDFEITVGTPPVSQLIKKEIGVELGSGAAHENKVGNIAIEQVIKLAKMKMDSMIVKDMKAAVKSVVGSCHSMGVMIESKPAKETEAAITAGKYDSLIKNGVTEVSAEKAQALKEVLAKAQSTYATVSAKRKAEQAAAAEAKEKKAEEAKAAAGPAKKEEAPAAAKK